MTYTSMAVHARANLLNQLAGMMEASPPEGETAFPDAIKALVMAGVQTTSIAKHFDVAIPTVTRWGQGRVPHPLMRRAIAGRLAALARRHAEDALRGEVQPLKAA